MILTTSAVCDAYQWIGPDGASAATLTNPLLTTTTSTTTIPMGDDAYDAGMWAVICIDADGCVSEPSSQVEMVINEIPAMPLPTNDGSVCAGTEFTLIAGAGYGADAQYAWYNVNPSTVGATVISTQQNLSLIHI